MLLSHPCCRRCFPTPTVQIRRTYITSRTLAKLPQSADVPGRELRIIKSPIKIHAPLPGPTKKDTMSLLDGKLKDRYDPEGLRRKMLDRRSGTLRPGMVLSVATYNNYPAEKPVSTFSGYLMGIKRAGVESSIRLRTSVMRVGTEMRFPVFSPTVKEINIIRAKPARKIRRAKLFYIRTEKHDRGSVDGIVKAHRDQKVKQR